MSPVSFRPLAGIMVLIAVSASNSSILIGDVSVPLRGLWFLSSSFAVMMFVSFLLPGFRPLAGIMVLIER